MWCATQGPRHPAAPNRRRVLALLTLLTLLTLLGAAVSIPLAAAVAPTR
ncbi:hypothetical protein GCM10010502_40930 [Kitasatospora aureofaciens]|uniref:Uncharacterized protein n=1 Tax=Kitasatospora aureofaciens TaxID=1894 RepID=A0A8H9HRY9_KITAU|nr:hypothetical protein GCM10010502_40930 [Kitasatospora aureofaciens]